MWRALSIVLVTACGSQDFLVVTIEAKPAVHDVAELDVTLLDATGTSRGDTFTVTTEAFPSTFSVSTDSASGDLTISISAKNRDGFIVGRGSGATTFATPTATVTLDSADFVINTDFADDQIPAADFESIGFQVGASPDGTWTSVFRDGCAMPCNMLARRFDVTGRPVESGIAAGTNAFAVSTALSDGFFTSPATASNANTTVAVWNFSEPPPGTTSGVACRAMDASGNAVGAQVIVVVEPGFPFAVAVTALSNGKFAVAWNATSPTSIIRSALVNPQCQPSNQVDISTVVAGIGANRTSITAKDDRVFVAWTLDGDARFRITSATNNAPMISDTLLVAKTAAEQVRFVRVAPLATGFAVVVRWAAIDGVAPGKIELYRTNVNGGVMGIPTLVTTKSGSDFESAQGFSIATRSEDGALLVSWQACAANGDGSGCGVFGRILRPNGVPVGAEFNLASTTDLDQTIPSVVGLPGAFAATWKDLSGKDPDKAGSAVRGRILYPAYNDATRVIGATCTSNADCDEGLACGASSDGGQRCFVVCQITGTPPTCPAGGTCAAASAGNACLF